jgi:hypothetical protein
MKPLKNPRQYKICALALLVFIALTLEVANGAVWSSVLGVR